MNHRLRKRHNIYLVRHGESEANVDVSILKNKADCAVNLTELGHKQAAMAAKYLVDHIEAEDRLYSKDSLYSRKLPIHVWISPYNRTRQTAEYITEAFSEKWSYRYTGSTESPLLVEQSFGICNGRHDDNMWDGHPKEEHLSRLLKQGNPAGRFWSPMPHGESQFHVTQRVHQFFDEIYNFEDPNGMDAYGMEHIIVGHGVVNRAFRMMWMNYNYEFWSHTKNPKNCEVWHIQNGYDKGSIYVPTS
jgi:2,3-bisphosphoglycerate-dependent phosphoglycerate mutase